MADFQLQDKASTGASRRRFDPWLVGAAIFFVAAAALSAAPALKAGPVTLAGLLLLLGVAGVAVLGPGGHQRLGPRGNDVDQAEGFIDALSEPAALAAADGRLLAANLAWREVMGEQRRLPKGVAGSSLFAALVQARKGEMAAGRAARRRRRP
jgi:two-component system cell cycle sensor histidine kinase/response regulator CckA